jgi:hypothetical protein
VESREMIRTSRSQLRACQVLGLEPRKRWEDTLIVLENRGVNGNGIPEGYDWKSASKLDDDSLRHELLNNVNYRVIVPVPSNRALESDESDPREFAH